MAERRDNYIIARDRTRAVFPTYDLEKIVEKFALDADGDFLYTRFFDLPFRVGRRDGVVAQLEDGQWTESGFDASMTLYDILCDSKPHCRASGRFANVWNQKNVSSAPDGGLFQSRADAFAGRTALLAAACERMGGKRAGAGDVSYNLPVFQALQLRLSFWDADDEFPASLSLLWDENVLDFMRYETTFYAAGYLLDRLNGWMNRI